MQYLQKGTCLCLKLNRRSANPMSGDKRTIQKNLPRNNNGSRNNRPCPNPHIMEILSFSVFTLIVVAHSLLQALPDVLCDITTAPICTVNDTIYRFTI